MKKVSAKGFSLLELVLALAIIAVVSAIAVMGFASAKASVDLGNVRSQLTGHLEQARLDAIKRHAEPGAESSVQVVDANTYRLAVDFNGDGTLEAAEIKDFNLPEGVTFLIDLMPPAAEFDANGQLQSDIAFSGQSRAGEFTVRLSKLGGVSQQEGAPVMPAVSGTPYPTPTPTPTPMPAATPAAPAGNAGCVFSLGTSNSPFSIRKNGQTTGIVRVLLSVYRSPSEVVTVTYETANLNVSPASATITPDGYAEFRVIDIKNAHFHYQSKIEFHSPCGTKEVTVQVTP